MRDRRALEALLQAAEDEDVEVQLSVVEALVHFLDDEAVVKRVMAFVDYGDVAVRMKAIEILGEGKVVAAVDRLIAAIGNVFLRSYAEEALRRIGDRRGYLAVVRRKKREALFPKKAKMERAKLDKLRDKRNKNKKGR